MSKDDLVQIANKSISDYGFRQVVVWSPQDIVDRWELNEDEMGLLTSRIIPKLKDLPVPVEPAEEEQVKKLFVRIIDDQY